MHDWDGRFHSKRAQGCRARRREFVLRYKVMSTLARQPTFRIGR